MGNECKKCMGQEPDLKTQGKIIIKIFYSC